MEDNAAATVTWRRGKSVTVERKRSVLQHVSGLSLSWMFGFFFARTHSSSIFYAGVHQSLLQCQQLHFESWS